jgi:hypothetical protein
MRVEFTRSLGRFIIREGIVRGRLIGATVDGYIDYSKDEVHMRGTFVPFYGLNNMFGQIPIFGLFLGGSNEGCSASPMRWSVPPGAPVLRVNPISAVAPGLLRKFFEFPTTTGGTQTYVPRKATPIRPRDKSHRLQQHVALSSERELDDAFGRQLRAREHHPLVVHRGVVHRSPPPLIWRRASPFELTRPA